jgi:hypothetical protein
VRRIGANLRRVFLHEHDMAESLVVRNANMANHQDSTLPFLLVLMFLDGDHQEEILDIAVVVKPLIHVRVARR